MTTVSEVYSVKQALDDRDVRDDAAPLVISCNAPVGGGGLGQHLGQLVGQARQARTLAAYYCSHPAAEDGAGHAIGSRLFTRVERYTPVRFSPGWKGHLCVDLFDRSVAAALAGPVDTFVGFVGQSLRTFRRARRLGARRLVLQAANSHVDNVTRLHARATHRFPFESSWLNAAQRAKTIREYQEADEIVVASEYSRNTFLAQGFAGRTLRRLHLATHSRFVPADEQTRLAARNKDGISLDVVYTGSLTVMKGVPLLIEAFARLPDRTARLTLVGGWATRGMRRFLQAAIERDPRIRIRPGDPLPHLQRADVCVHPTYEDGWAYAPAEALACGVPVIATEDTGMSELIRDGENGWVIPSGDADAIYERLDQLRRRPQSLKSRTGV